MTGPHSHTSALETRANSGLGFEAARQLAEPGCAAIVLTCRTQVEVDEARAALVEATRRGSVLHPRGRRLRDRVLPYDRRWGQEHGRPLAQSTPAHLTDVAHQDTAPAVIDELSRVSG